MSNILSKIKTLILKLFGLLEEEKVDEIKEEKPAPTQEEKPVESKPTEEEKETKKATEPRKSRKDGTITTCLWKPISENDGNPVILVSSDTIRTSDLHMEIIGKGKKALKVEIHKSSHRANQSGGHKFARIHFRVRRHSKKFKKSAPLKLRFYQKRKGEKIPVKVLGKSFFVVKNPTRRTGS